MYADVFTKTEVIFFFPFLVCTVLKASTFGWQRTEEKKAHQHFGAAIGLLFKRQFACITMEKMSRQLPLNPTFIPPPYGVLRSLLENPLKLPLHPEDGERCLGIWAQGRDDTPRDPLVGRAPASLFPSPRFSEIGGLTPSFSPVQRGSHI